MGPNAGTTAPSSTKKRLEIYDWLRGLAAIAVVLEHFKPFDAPKYLFTWEIHGFVLLSMALVADKHLGFRKILSRLSYLAFVYAANILTFRPLFFFFDPAPQPSFHSLFFEPRPTLLANHYFSHLWYFILYAQMLFFLAVSLDALKKFPKVSVLAASLLVSQACFLGLHYGLKSYDTILLPVWFFVMACGFYELPRLANWMDGADRGRPLRWALSLAALIAAFGNPFVSGLLASTDARTSLVNTAFFYLVIYFLAETFFLIRNLRPARPVIQYVSSTGRYTLVLYIFHQGLWNLVKKWTVPPPELLTVLSLTLGIVYGRWVNRAYGACEAAFRQLSGAAAQWLRREGFLASPEGLMEDGESAAVDLEK